MESRILISNIYESYWLQQARYIAKMLLAAARHNATYQHVKQTLAQASLEILGRFHHQHQLPVSCFVPTHGRH